MDRDDLLTGGLFALPFEDGDLVAQCDEFRLTRVAILLGCRNGVFELWGAR
ncbi:hypothetical protein ACQPYE_27740 [Actinosynnema sp. CA-299493]